MTVLADTSVWIEYLRGVQSPVRDTFVGLLDARAVVTTDAVLLEVLAGPTAESEADRLWQVLAGIDHVRQESPLDAEGGAAVFRACRRGGETPRSMLDCLIAAVAIRIDVSVLHRDRDFDVIARHTALRIHRP